MGVAQLNNSTLKEMASSISLPNLVLCVWGITLL
jgi:hypothetical protein